MAGMEELEIHSKSYLIRWINVKPEHTVSWAVQPHKKSINFGIFKHPGHLAGLAPSLPSTISLPPPSPSAEGFDATKDTSVKKDVPPTVAEKLASVGLKQVFWAGKCEADKVSQGKYEVPIGEGGNYALVFDNTFSKNVSKTATVFLLSYPTKYAPDLHFGAQVHHSSALASALSGSSASQKSKSSPKLNATRQESVDSLKQAFHQASISASKPEASDKGEPNVVVPMMIHTGVLQKRRRKRHQGYARRFFSLDFTSSTLSYYHDRNSSALRGSIPLSLAVIGANAKTREISIDSGAEIWHLKANNKIDFDSWKQALERASRLLIEASTPSKNLKVHTDLSGNVSPKNEEDRNWARAEALLSKISGTRDAVRRLCIQTETRALFVQPPGAASGSTPSTPTEVGGEEFFRGDEKRPFWKRKTSSNSVQSSAFKRSISAQLAVPAPSIEPVIRTGLARTPSPVRSPQRSLPYHSEEIMNDYCRAMLHDLDSIVAEFSSLLTESRQRRTPLPETAASRLSIQSFESQEYFDAEDNTHFITIQSDSDDEANADEVVIADGDSATSSDIDDTDGYVQSKKRFRSSSLASLIPPPSKSLVPLPMDGVIRRTKVPAPTVMPPSLIGFLRKNVGKDLSTISMPVSANEPSSLLQRAAEQLEYSSLIDRAAKATDAVERLIYVSAFAVSSLSNARVKERSIRKPFNPMLGETFELVREDQGFRFVAEKVSHRPVQLAFHAESGDWSFTQSPLPSQKFWGKSSEIMTDGKARLLLHASGECLSWSASSCFLRNMIAGEKYVEPVGTMTIVNETTGHKAVVTFKTKGMFSGRSEDVEVHTFDSHGAEMALGLQGTWTQSLQLREHGAPTKTTMWSVGALVDHAPKHYGMTLFAATLNEITSIERGKLAPTDSRLRPDQRALEEGDPDEAERLKNVLEESQRARRREMEEANQEWKPRWFTRVDNDGEIVWKLKTGKDGYWEERAKGSWTGVVPVLSI